MRKLLMLIATSVAVGTAGAQVDTRPDVVACADSNVTGMYRRCALSMDGQRVRRGQDGAVVARPGFFSPLRLSRVVTGDSARAHAFVFERKTKQAAFFNIAGVVLLVTGALVADCDGLSFSSCPGSNGAAPLMFFLGGTTATFIGVQFQLGANRAAARSIWWNNERFAR